MLAPQPSLSIDLVVQETPDQPLWWLLARARPLSERELGEIDALIEAFVAAVQLAREG